MRARSHRLAEGLGPDLFRRDPGNRSRREVSKSILRDLGYPIPLALALIVELAAFPSVLRGWSWPVAAANLLIAGSFIDLAVAGARRLMPLPRAGWARPTVIVGPLAALALVLSITASVLVTAIAGPFPFAVGPAVVLLVIFVLGLSIWSSVTRERQQRRQSMMAAVSDEAQELERVWGEVARRRAAAAEFLHGPIQSQLVALSLKGETNEQAVEAIEKRFAEYNARRRRGMCTNKSTHSWMPGQTSCQSAYPAHLRSGSGCNANNSPRDYSSTHSPKLSPMRSVTAKSVSSTSPSMTPITECA